MSPHRVLFMGTPEFAVPPLRALLADPRYEVIGVVTQPDRPAGRGRELRASPVKEVALEANVPVLQPTKMKPPETRELLAALTPDVAVVAAYGRILPPQLLAVPTHGCINLHASILPRWRGASPIARAIAAGDHETGVAFMRMDEGLDTGPVYAVERLPIAPTDDTGTLTAKLAALAAAKLPDVLERILGGQLTVVAQAAQGVALAPPLTKADGELDFRRSAEDLERHVRAMRPWPGAFATLRGERLLIGASCVVSAEGEPGTVVATDKRGVVVACSKGALCLQEVQPAGKRMMPAAAWAAGRAQLLGARFDAPSEASANKGVS